MLRSETKKNMHNISKKVSIETFDLNNTSTRNFEIKSFNLEILCQKKPNSPKAINLAEREEVSNSKLKKKKKNRKKIWTTLFLL